MDIFDMKSQIMQSLDTNAVIISATGDEKIMQDLELEQHLFWKTAD